MSIYQSLPYALFREVVLLFYPFHYCLPRSRFSHYLNFTAFEHARGIETFARPFKSHTTVYRDREIFAVSGRGSNPALVNLCLMCLSLGLGADPNQNARFVVRILRVWCLNSLWEQYIIFYLNLLHFKLWVLSITILFSLPQLLPAILVFILTIFSFHLN